MTNGPSPRALAPRVRAIALPTAITRANPRASRRFLEFFAAEVRNPNTRRAYAAAARRFFAWSDAHGLELEQLSPVHLATYVELLGRELAPTSVKQHLAGLRMLFDYLVIGHGLEHNPANSVRAPRHSQTTGKTPVLFGPEARQLFDSIDTSSIVGARDRALLALMTYSFARIGAALLMRRGDYRSVGRRAWFVLHEKGGKYHEVPAHHLAAEDLDHYLALANILDAKAPLFQSVRSGQLTGRPLDSSSAWSAIRKHAARAGLDLNISAHTFRATGITAFLSNGGDLETAAAIAAHASPRTTKLYDRRNVELQLQEIERIRL